MKNYKVGEVFYLYPKSLVPFLKEYLKNDPGGLEKCIWQFETNNKCIVVSVNLEDQTIVCRTAKSDIQFEMTARQKTFSEEEFNGSENEPIC